MPWNTPSLVWFIAAAGLSGLSSLPASRAAAVHSGAALRHTEVTSVFEVPSTVRNVFPAANFNRNVTTNWWETEVLDGQPTEEASDLASSLEDASFIVLDQDFYQILEDDRGNTLAAVETIFDFPPGPSFANRIVHDGTVYSPECNCIFLAELHPPKKGFSADFMPWVWRVNNLNTSNPTTEKVYPSPPLTMANGAYYHNGSIYWAQEGNYSTPGGILRMDPMTLETEVVLNNFMGHRFNSPNDVVITRAGVVYFTDGYYGFDNFNDTLRPELANGLWRWDMGGTNNLRMVAGAAGGPFVNPNGVALNLAEDKIYVTNRGNASDNPAGGRTIYEFELHDNGVPVRGGDVFASADAGFPDGVKVDREGRVYGGVSGGVSVFDSSGKQLGLIKVADGDVAVNMVWVGNWLYIAGREHLYRVQLSTVGAQTF